MTEKPKNYLTYSIRNQLFKFLEKRNYIVNNFSGETNLKNFFNSIKPVEIEEGLIRIGGQHDGGYLVPNLLDSIKYCFSPGVDVNANFELQLASEYNIESFMLDLYVDKAPVDNNSFNFIQKNLNTYNNDENITFEKWYRDSVGDTAEDSILQMDIEGYEYQVLFDIPHEILSKFKILVVEFHDFGRQLFEPIGHNYVGGLFQKLLGHFSVVHIHANNCCPVTEMKGFEIPKVVEITFLNKKYINPTGNESPIPHPLDEKNVIEYPDIYFKKMWE